MAPEIKLRQFELSAPTSRIWLSPPITDYGPGSTRSREASSSTHMRLIGIDALVLAPDSVLVTKFHHRHRVMFVSQKRTRSFSVSVNHETYSLCELFSSVGVGASRSVFRML